MGEELDRVQKQCFEISSMEHVVDIKLVTEPLRNLQETLSTQNLIILRNFHYLARFLVSYKKVRQVKNIFSNTKSMLTMLAIILIMVDNHPL